MPHENGTWFRGISVRKAEVLALIEQNYNQAEIAERLGVPLSTVHSHVKELEELTGCGSMGELGRWWTANKHTWLHEMARIAGIKEAS